MRPCRGTLTLPVVYRWPSVEQNLSGWEPTQALSNRKKLIEVAMPLEAINVASAREKSIRHGHPSTLHLWWARRPLAACRAVLFGQMVDDPSSVPEEFPTDEGQDAERQRLFRIIEELVKWENSANETVLHAARTEIARSVARQAGVAFPSSPNAARRLATQSICGPHTVSIVSATRSRVPLLVFSYWSKILTRLTCQ
jgi:Protein of unknown function (DUF1156)